MNEGGRKVVTPYASLQEQITGAIPRAGTFQSDLESLWETLCSMEPMLYDMEKSGSEFTNRYLLLLEKVKALIPLLLQQGTQSNRMKLEIIHENLKNLFQEYVKKEMKELADSKEVADDQPVETSVQQLLTYLGSKIRNEVSENPTNSSKPVFQNLDKTLGSLETEFHKRRRSSTSSSDHIHILPPNYKPQLLLLLNQVKFLLRFLNGNHGLDIARLLQTRQKQLRRFILEDEEARVEKMNVRQNKSTYRGKQKKYDIFLNFRGLDVRYTIAGLLHNNLEKANISTFFDERSAPKSKRYWEEIQKAISASVGAITILSENYGDSEDCLDELVQIQKREKKCKDYMVRPIFYDVKPEHLTDPKSKFGQGLQKHKNTAHQGKMKQWTEALVYVRSFSGDVHNSNQDHLDVLIDKIVEGVKSHLQNMRGRRR